MCNTSPDVQKQLSEAVSLIAKYDFPHQWSNLWPQLNNMLSKGDLTSRKGVMVTANSIMKRFRYIYKSDALFLEILYALYQVYQIHIKHYYHLYYHQFYGNKEDIFQL
jgi:exportin-2 (importin alpha re-exporter)